jgi:hypothetical protein
VGEIVSEEEVVRKVSGLMATIDDVKRYAELGASMVDFATIIVASLAAALALCVAQAAYDVAVGIPTGSAVAFFGILVPASPYLGLGVVIVFSSGLVIGALWVRRRVERLATGGWRKTLEEGVPGAVKLLSETDWDALLSTVRLARPAYLFYAILKVVGYSIAVVFILVIGAGIGGLWYVVPLNLALVGVLSAVGVLLLTKGSLAKGYQKLQSLDLLFWDLRWFSSEFKRAKFNQA